MISSERYCLSCGAANLPEAESCFACGLSLKITLPLPQETTPNHQHLLQKRYRILSQVGKGGFSAVYKAEDTLFNNHPVAIKAITLSGLKPHEVIEATEAFNREILVLTGLKHPHLPHIYHHFSDIECWYLVMDFIEGTTLEKHLEKTPDGRLPLGEVLTSGLLLCSVLEYLHSRQPPIIFRDLKPANIMLTPAGGITLIDFGIARHFKPGQAKDTMPFGSPGYAAPEQYGKAQTTPRTDIYSLGVILHQLITGDDPSQAPFRFAPLQLQDQSALAGLETLIMQMVEMDATKRPENIVVVKQELQRITNAWSTQQMRGLPAQGLPYQPLPTVPISWQATIPPMWTGTPIAAGSANVGQLVLLQRSAPGAGGSTASSTGTGSSAGYWSTPASQTKWNWMAIASLFFGIISIFMPLFSCSISTALTAYIGWAGFRFFFLVLIITIAPAVVAVVCGHIGRRRAVTVPGWLGSKDMASAGMAIGYVFGSIYLGFLCLVLMVFLSFR